MTNCIETLIYFQLLLNTTNILSQWNLQDERDGTAAVIVSIVSINFLLERLVIIIQNY